MVTDMDLAEWAGQARAWLAARLQPRPAQSDLWGVGSDDVSVFRDLTQAEESAWIAAIRDWQRVKFDAGYGAITWSTEFGGVGLSGAYARAFRREESRFELPGHHEVAAVSLNLIAPTIRAVGTDAQRERFLRPLLRGDQLACQLFSEPGAGSDLAGLRCGAVRDGDAWVLNGQKVWSSGAQFADLGEIICRSDPSVPKHKGMTAFLLPMDTPGVEVRQIRQMSGGASFNEVFLTDVRLPDDLRLGEVGAGWKVALTTLGYERAGENENRGGTYRDVIALASWLERTDDPLVRQRLARLYIGHHAMSYTARRIAAAARTGTPPGPESSIMKYSFTNQQKAVGEAALSLLGPRIAADTGEWGTWAWSKFLLGAPANRIAGGSDEIQRNIIAERVLNLPEGPRIDRDRPFNEI
jgi:alkylation response protein AidB-like acyl-CoA dehydrogenase